MRTQTIRAYCPKCGKMTRHMFDDATVRYVCAECSEKKQ